MRQALEVASQAGLHEVEFRVQRILSGVVDCERALAAEVQPATEPMVQTEELREVSASLAQLVG